ncbi:MAG: sulfotransferase, partial [Candidatus Electrothrix sp. GM3_4]|nr:sulfotransferase [Candidatus Electrothrix sp. GM3_4]
MEKICSPLEIRELTGQILAGEDLQKISLSELVALEQLFADFIASWEETYIRFAQDSAGELGYRNVILFFKENILPKIHKHLSEDGLDRKAVVTIEFMLFPQGEGSARRTPLFRNWRRRGKDIPQNFECPLFDRPLFIVSAPRSGSTLLFETLSKFKEIWTIGRESHDIEKDIPYLHPSSHNYISNRLTDLPPDISDEIKKWFTRQLRDRNGKFCFMRSATSSAPVRFLEKTPKNALRIPFWKKVFPDAKFIFLYREPRENISSMLEGWRSNRFLAYRDMPGWPYKEWHFLLPQGWKKCADRPLAEIAAYQWNAANQTILDDLHTLHEEDWCFLTYKELVQAPEETVQKITDFAGIRWDSHSARTVSGPLPLSSMVVSPPSTDKWHKYSEELSPFLTMSESLARRV